MRRPGDLVPSLIEIACSMDWMKLVELLVTWALVVAGWLVVRAQAMHVESVRLGMSEISALRAEVRRIEAEAVCFHTKEFDAVLQRDLLGSMKRVARDCKSLQSCGWLQEDWSRFVVDFRRSVTLSNWSKASFVLRSIDSEEVKEISDSAAALDRFLADTSAKLLTRKKPLWGLLLGEIRG